MDFLTTVADTLNREYQAGGDTATLVHVAHALLASLEHDGERAHFAEVVSMGGLPLGTIGEALVDVARLYPNHSSASLSPGRPDTNVKRRQTP